MSLKNKLKLQLDVKDPDKKKESESASSETKGKAGGKGRNRQRFATRKSKLSVQSKFERHPKSKPHSAAFKTACTLSYKRTRGTKWRFILLGTSELHSVLAYRWKTALGVSSQSGKLQTVWQLGVAVDYSAILFSCLRHYMQKDMAMMAFNKDVGVELSAMDRAEINTLVEKGKVSNINTPIFGFTGTLDGVDKGVAIQIPNYAAKLDLAEVPGGYVENHSGLLHNEDSMADLVFEFNLRPGEIAIALFIKYADLLARKAGETEMLDGEDWTIAQFATECYAKDGTCDVTHPFQRFRWNGFINNVLSKCALEDSQKEKALKEFTEGGLNGFLKSLKTNWGHRHFGLFAMKTQVTDRLVTSVTGDRSLTAVRMREVKQYGSVFDPSLLTVSTMPIADAGFVERRGFTNYAVDTPSVDVQEVISCWPMRTFPCDCEPSLIAHWMQLSKYCNTEFYLESQAVQSTTALETIREAVFKYLCEVFPVGKETQDVDIEDATTKEELARKEDEM